MLHTLINKDLITAMKNRDIVAKEVLSMLKSKLQLKAIEAHVTELDDASALTVVQKFIKESEDEMAEYLKAGREDTAHNIAAQLRILKGYLPAQMTEDEIRAEIAKLEDKSMKSVMSHFKANFAGKADMSLVSKLARGL